MSAKGYVWRGKITKTFLETCGKGVDRLGTEEAADRITQITASYTAMIEHGSGCDDCKEGRKVGDR